MIAVYLVCIITGIAGSGYLAYRSRDFRKFLAGAFFVSAGVQLYLAWVGVSIPVAGTSVIQTPDVGWIRGSIHAVLCVLAIFFGFFHNPKQSTVDRDARSPGRHG